ncbi:MAG: diguanylate cyclase [Micropepsaceae bacterium]
MSISLKVKLTAATLASAVTIALLAAAVETGSGEITDRLTQSQMATVALRNHTQADMMHDAVRADVFAALYFARIDQTRRNQIAANMRAHVTELVRLSNENRALLLPDEVKTLLDGVRGPMNDYIGTADALVEAAFNKDPQTETLLAEFSGQFETLAKDLGAAGDRIEAFVKAQTASADAFSRQASLLGKVTLALGGVIAILTTWVTQRGVLGPIAKLNAALQRLARGEYDAVLPTKRGDEIGLMARTVAAFGREAGERNRLTREATVLSELNEWLQSAKSETELYQMIAEFLSRFLPDATGAIYIYANSRDVLECAKVWNGTQATQTMHPDDCWGLRRGRIYTHGQHEIEFDCSHVQPGSADDYCCIPILAHGETVGLLHLELKVGEAHADRKAVFTDQRRLGLAAVEHISLAIANVKLRDQLRDQSIRDVLTGLYNRRYLLETARREFQRAARGGQSVAVLSIDVDHFKRFNDNHGHDAGDTVLRAVSEAITATFRGDDVPCRFGGEEFVALLPGASLQEARDRAEELRAKIEATTVRYGDGNLPRITISVGVAAFPEFGNGVIEVLKVADAALYEAKRNGRNRVETAHGGAVTPQRPGAELNEAILARLTDGSGSSPAIAAQG